ncbi:MAG: DUF5688 family protein [Thermoflexaceae bacterium]|nr:DUF5688 family protein [Thermoflexaceae bacterium]
MVETRFEGQAFEEELLKRLQQTAGDGDTVCIKTMDKNNGQKRRGIVIRSAESKVSPVFYLDLIYESYMEGMDLEQIVEVIWQYYAEDENIRKIDVHDFLDWERVKSRLFLRVISTDMNKISLETAIHKDILDLSAVVYVKVDCPSGVERASIIVRKEHLSIWGQREDDVYEIALQNTRQENISFVSITNAISSLLSERDLGLLLCDEQLAFDCPLYVLTNEASHFGAVYMLLPEVMDRIADEKEDDLYILPSSIHEILILPVSEVKEPSYLRDLVQDANEKQILMEDILSDHVYRYSKEYGLTIAA